MNAFVNGHAGGDVVGIEHLQRASEVQFSGSVALPADLRVSGATKCQFLRRDGRRAARRKIELRNRAKSTLPAEAAALAGAAEGAVLVIPSLKEKIEAQLGHSICLVGVYRMLARHGWRKLARRQRAPARQSASTRGGGKTVLSR